MERLSKELATRIKESLSDYFKYLPRKRELRIDG